MAVSHLAVLRGINVGGKNKILMSDLSALFAGAGCMDVRTFIQSGNVIFNAPTRMAAQVPRLVAQRIEESFGYKIPVVLRSLVQLEDAISNNPFLALQPTQISCTSCSWPTCPPRARSRRSTRSDHLAMSTSCGAGKSICGFPTGSRVPS